MKSQKTKELRSVESGSTFFGTSKTQTYCCQNTFWPEQDWEKQTDLKKQIGILKASCKPALVGSKARSLKIVEKEFSAKPHVGLKFLKNRRGEGNQDFLAMHSCFLSRTFKNFMAVTQKKFQ